MTFPLEDIETKVFARGQPSPDSRNNVALANAKTVFAAFNKWYCALCDKNKALVKQYIQNNRRLPSGKDLELDTAGACKNDKPFVAPAARYVLKEGKVSWFVVDTTSNRVVIITRTNGAKIMVKPGTTEQDVEVKDAGWTWGE